MRPHIYWFSTNFFFFIKNRNDDNKALMTNVNCSHRALGTKPSTLNVSTHLILISIPVGIMVFPSLLRMEKLRL